MESTLSLVQWINLSLDGLLMPDDSAKPFATVEEWNEARFDAVLAYPYKADALTAREKATIRALFAERVDQANVIVGLREWLDLAKQREITKANQNYDFQQAELAWQSGERQAEKKICDQAKRIRELESARRHIYESHDGLGMTLCINCGFSKADPVHHSGR